MKIQPESKSQDELSVHAEKQIEKKIVFIGSTRLTPGHRVFEVNIETMACIEANYEKEVHFNAPDRRKIIIKPGCQYVCALNKQNAIKRYLRCTKGD